MTTLVILWWCWAALASLTLCAGPIWSVVQEIRDTQGSGNAVGIIVATLALMLLAQHAGLCGWMAWRLL